MAVGLLGRRLHEGQRHQLKLELLHSKLAVRGASLTPGAVSAHAVSRRLAQKAAEGARRQAATERLRTFLEAKVAGLPGHVRERVEPSEVWNRLSRGVWVSRILAAPDPEVLVDSACSVLAALPVPDERRDRRTLVPGAPHALDAGETLAGLVLAMANLSGRPSRAAWDSLGIDCDDLLGGLISLGVHPAGWTLPDHAVVTIPPRELSRCEWAQPPFPGAWVFVTENPSILAAAADQVSATGVPIRLLCTSGTPSEVERKAIGRLSDAGWSVAVRADFDHAGLGHVRALLLDAPEAVPWRMSSADYLASNPGEAAGYRVDPAWSPWDPSLAAAITGRGAPAFEEDLLKALLEDMLAGEPAIAETRAEQPPA